MPHLPSGMTLGVGHQAIPYDMGLNWFKCPEGHFWYTRPDEKITPPPYDGTTSILEDWVHAQVPVTTEEAKKYVYVLYMRPDGRFQWRGEWLCDFPHEGQLDAADLQVWNEWMDGEPGQSFLKKVIGICEQQAELNKNCSGFAVFSSSAAGD